jgi:hypothetical protein
MQPHYSHQAEAPDCDTGENDEEEDDYSRFLDEDDEQQQSDAKNDTKTWIARPNHRQTAREVQPDPDVTDLNEEADEASETVSFSVFESISHRGKPLAYDISGRPVAFDRPDSRLQATAAAAAAQLCNLTIAQSGDERHKEALMLLQKIWSESAGSLCQEVELRTGDILLSDNSVLLTPYSLADAESVAGAVHTALYDEIHVLRSCAVDRRYSGAGSATEMAGGDSELDRPVNGRSHMLWLGLQLDSKNLKWWWW